MSVCKKTHRYIISSYYKDIYTEIIARNFKKNHLKQTYTYINKLISLILKLPNIALIYKYPITRSKLKIQLIFL